MKSDSQKRRSARYQKEGKPRFGRGKVHANSQTVGALSLFVWSIIPAVIFYHYSDSSFPPLLFVAITWGTYQAMLFGYEWYSQPHILEPTKKPAKKGRTAILIIHGIGQQKPLSTLGELVQVLRKGAHIKPDEEGLSHGLTRRIEDGRSWMQSYVRMIRGKNKVIDIYEYYWAPEMQGLVDFPAINRRGRLCYLGR